MAALKFGGGDPLSKRCPHSQVKIRVVIEDAMLAVVEAG